MVDSNLFGRLNDSIDYKAIEMKVFSTWISIELRWTHADLIYTASQYVLLCLSFVTVFLSI